MTIPLFDTEEQYRYKTITIEGSRSQDTEIFLFAISTCMWCRLGKKWLKDRGYRYTYLDIDTIPVADKNSLKVELGRLAGQTPGFPFLILNGEKWHSGFDASVWEEMLHD